MLVFGGVYPLTTMFKYLCMSSEISQNIRRLLRRYLDCDPQNATKDFELGLLGLYFSLASFFFGGVLTH